MAKTKQPILIACWNMLNIGFMKKKIGAQEEEVAIYY